jgi:hypothetical protein
MSIETVPSKGIEIWNKIVEILTNAMVGGQPLDYVQELCQGVRDDLPKLPAIILEPLQEPESNHTIPQGKKVTLKISITCWIDAYGVDKQIVGDDASIGIMDFVKDVKNALNAYPNLGQAGNVTMIRFPQTVYSISAWPNRAADITLEADYLCQSTTR